MLRGMNTKDKTKLTRCLKKVQQINDTIQANCNSPYLRRKQLEAISKLKHLKDELRQKYKGVPLALNL